MYNQINKHSRTDSNLTAGTVNIVVMKFNIILVALTKCFPISRMANIIVHSVLILFIQILHPIFSRIIYSQMTKLCVNSAYRIQMIGKKLFYFHVFY
jgi:hypothetical protein